MVSGLRTTEIGSGDGVKNSPRAWPLRRTFWDAARAGGPLVVCVAGLFFCLGQFAGAVQKGEKVIRAEAVEAGSFKLIAPGGKSAAVIRTADRGGALLEVLDGMQRVRLRLGIGTRGQPRIDLLDAEGHPSLSLRSDEDDAVPRIVLSRDAPGRAEIRLEIDDLGPRASFSEKNGGRARVGLDERGVADLDLRGPSKKPGVILSANDMAGPLISLFRDDERRNLTLSTTPDGDPAISLADETGKVVSKISLDKEGKASVFKPGN